MLQKQQHSQSSPLPIPQSDFVDESFYHELEERAKKADHERREAARRARDYFHRQSSQLNICFDTDDNTTFALQPIPLNANNRTIPIEKKVEIEFDERETPAFPTPSENLEINQESQSVSVNGKHQRS
jgi:hypothetical protein